MKTNGKSYTDHKIKFRSDFEVNAMWCICEWSYSRRKKLYSLRSVFYLSIVFKRHCYVQEPFILIWYYKPKKYLPMNLKQTIENWSIWNWENSFIKWWVVNFIVLILLNLRNRSLQSLIDCMVDFLLILYIWLGHTWTSV